jgi:hypothetical protein
MNPHELATAAFEALCAQNPDPGKCDELAAQAARAYREANGLDPADRYAHLRGN